MSKYLYCRTYWDRESDIEPEVRRYVIRKELKTLIHFEPNHCVRRDGKWHEVEGKPVTIAKWGKPETFGSAIGNFKRHLPRDWTEGKPEPEPGPGSAEWLEKLMQEERFESDAPFTDILNGLAATRPDWSAFGFEMKPSLAEFKAAYRRESLRLHPDRGGDAAEFKAMQHQAEQPNQKERCSHVRYVDVGPGFRWVFDAEEHPSKRRPGWLVSICNRCRGFIGRRPHDSNKQEK
jgi:hypothetical protein